MIQPIPPADPRRDAPPAVDPVHRRRRIADDPRREDARDERRPPARREPPAPPPETAVDGDGHVDVLA
jgi:hypothetical protein